MIRMLTWMAAALGGVQMMAAATPEALGVSSKGLVAYLEACERELDYEHGFVLLRHGELVAEGSWAPFDTLNEPHALYSHSKSFTSTAVGLLVDAGKLDLDERVIDILPDKAPANPSENLKQLRVRDLLTMNVGAKHTDAERDDKFGDWEKAFLGNTIDLKPGTQFRYDSGATYTLAAIVERRSGERLMDFLKPRLFQPLGIATAWSTTSPSGTACGGWGMNMTTRELAKFGQLYLQKGLWNGRRLLSEEWIQLATARQTWSGAIAVTGEDGSDWHQGYGFQFWRCRHNCFRADGANGQYTIVMPEYDAVLSIHAGLGDMQKEINLVWQYILPAMAKDALPEDVPAQRVLKEKLARLAIAPVAGARDGDAAFCGRVFAFAEKSPHGIASLRLDRTADGWQATLVTAAGEQRFPVGYGVWARGKVVFDPGTVDYLGAIVGPQPVAASAAVENGELKLRALLTRGPQKLEVVFRNTPKGPTAAGALKGIGGGTLVAR